LEIDYYLRPTRTLEERLVALFRQAKVIGGLYRSLGQEGESVAAAYALDFKQGDVVRSLPMVVIIEDNGYAYSTPTSKQTAAKTLANKAVAVGCERETIDGNDVLAVYGTTKRAVERARKVGGVTLIEVKTFRLKGHAEHDNPVVCSARDHRRVARQRPHRALRAEPDREWPRHRRGLRGHPAARAQAAAALAKDGVSVEILDLRSIIPFDEEAILESVGRTNRVIILHEAPLTGGAGAELAARLDAPIKRVAALDVPTPYSPPLEEYYLPNRDKVIAAARELLAY
jgi:hypothetical protein